MEDFLVLAGGGLIAAAGALILVLALWWFVKKIVWRLIILILNSLGGLFLYLGLVYLVGFDLPVTFVTILITVLFGFPGSLTLIILHLAGML